MGRIVRDEEHRNWRPDIDWAVKANVVDVAAFREGAGRLLAEVQRIKAEGDYPAARALFETYGVHFDSKLRDEVVARVDARTITQPVVRLLADDTGQGISPFEIDLRKGEATVSGIGGRQDALASAGTKA